MTRWWVPLGYASGECLGPRGPGGYRVVTPLVEATLTTDAYTLLHSRQLKMPQRCGSRVRVTTQTENKHLYSSSTFLFLEVSKGLKRY